jgi:hypothetical protein
MKKSTGVWSLILLFAAGMPAGAASKDGPDAVKAAQSQVPQTCLRRTAGDFLPMTRTERAAEYVKSLVGVRAVAFTFLRAGVTQAMNTPGPWGQGGRGYGYRVASSFSQHAIAESFESGIALGLDEDNRYFASGKQGAGKRLKYALESAFLARHDDGSRSLSYSVLGGTLAGAFTSRLWEPDTNNSAGDALSSFGISIAVRAGVEVAREFAPGVFRRLIP